MTRPRPPPPTYYAFADILYLFADIMYLAFIKGTMVSSVTGVVISELLVFWRIATPPPR